MKKKYREITVNGKKFTWSSGKNNCDGDGGNLLTIWFEKKPIHKQLFGGHIEITPKLVSEIIETLN